MFDAAQAQGRTPHPKGEAQFAEEVAAFIAGTGAEVVWGGTSAHCHFPIDRIQMPDGKGPAIRQAAAPSGCPAGCRE